MAKRNTLPTRLRPSGNPRERALAWLRANGSPRLLMSMMLMTTVGSAFLASVQMHHWGVVPLVRYPLAVVAGWGVFLFLVGVWVLWQRMRNALPEPSSARLQRSNSSGIDVPLDIPARGGGGTWHGGGQFGGAGASDSFAAAPQDVAIGESLSVFSADSGSSGGSSDVGFDLDVGEAGGYLLLLAAVVLAAFAVFGAAIYAVYNAPIFFAELLIDGGVGTWLYRRANVASRPDWISTAIKRSVWPVVILVALFIGLAWTMNYVAPGTMTLSEAFNALATR
jgi:hypothetical protein